MSYVFLGVVSFIGSIFQTTAARHVWKNDMMSDEINQIVFGKMMKTIWVFTLIPIILMATAFVSPVLSFSLFLLMQIASILSVRKFNKMLSAKKQS